MTIKEIRNELRQVRYYYSNKKEMDRVLNIVENKTIGELIGKYSNAISHAEPKLYFVYCYLYVEGHTQVDLSDKWGYTPEYVYRLNDKLLRFLQKQLNS